MFLLICVPTRKPTIPQAEADDDHGLLPRESGSDQLLHCLQLAGALQKPVFSGKAKTLNLMQKVSGWQLFMSSACKFSDAGVGMPKHLARIVQASGRIAKGDGRPKQLHMPGFLHSHAYKKWRSLLNLLKGPCCRGAKKGPQVL